LIVVSCEVLLLKFGDFRIIETLETASIFASLQHRHLEIASVQDTIWARQS
jgi:hypothetical protein